MRTAMICFALALLAGCVVGQGPCWAAVLFFEDFEHYAPGSLDMNQCYWAPYTSPNLAINGDKNSGNPWFGPWPANGLVVTSPDGGVNAHGGGKFLRGSDQWDCQDLVNVAYRCNAGRVFRGAIYLDWYFYDPLGSATGSYHYADYMALCYYSSNVIPDPNTKDFTDPFISAPNVPSATQRLSLGASNVGGTGFDSTKYQARVVGTAGNYGSGGWFNLSLNRTIGWHHARISVGTAKPGGTNDVAFYIDNMSTPLLVQDSTTSVGYNIIQINTRFGTTPGYLDDITFGTYGGGIPAAPTVPASAASPYSAGQSLLRGQLHCHSYPDGGVPYDGSGTGPSSTVSKYRAPGYSFDFVAVTDHNIVSPESIGWQGWAPNSVEITHGDWNPLHYVNDTHVIAVGMSQGTTIGMVDYPTTWHIASDTAERVKRVHNHSGLAYVAHPDSAPYNIGVSDLISVWKQSRPDGLGTWTPWPSPKISSQNTWDRLVYALGTPVWGYVEDDYHPDGLSNGKLRKTWVAVPGPAGDWWGNIKEKLRSGNYYCYYTTSGRWPAYVAPPVICVTATQSGSQPVIGAAFDTQMDSIEFVGYKWGFFQKLKTAVSGTGDQYRANGTERFVRVMGRKEFSGGTLWITSQPIIINKSGYYSPYTSGGAQVQVTSPELRLRYLQADEKPSPPAAGYVGDSFDVTTDTGSVPPGATLQLSFDGEDTSAIGGTQYLAIYYYNEQPGAWMKVGGTIDPATATIEAPIAQLGKYCVSADLPPDTEPPHITIEAPATGQIINADTVVTTTVTDSIGAWRVRFYMNDHLLYEDADPLSPFGALIKVSDYCTGDWILKAEAEDLAGNVGTASIPIYIASPTTPLPTVTITSPTASTVLSGTFMANGTCGDDVAVASVALSIDGTPLGYAGIDGTAWTCSIDTTYLADGSRTLTATVVDYPGNSASVSVPVVINNSAVTTPIGSVKSATEGSTVRFADAIVVADQSIVGDGFYAEAINRASAVKVQSTADIHIGDSISIVGAMSAGAHESIVQAQDILRVSTGNALPKPLATYARKLLVAPDSIGKRVKLSGRRIATDTAAPARWFVLDDGSGVPVTCRLADGVTFDSAKTLHIVTGVASAEGASGVASPVLLVMNSGDIVGF